MRRNRSLGLALTLGVAAALTSAGCAKKEAPAPQAAAAEPTPADGGKIPITTSSAEAKAEFLQGRDMVEKLLITDAVAHFQKAVALDANFASAELNLAATAPTGTAFFEHLNKAVSLADKASNGERLLILATEAGANANVVKQKEYSTSSSPLIRTTSARTSIWRATTSGSRTTPRPSSTTGRRRSSTRASRRRTTCSATPTGRAATMRAPRRRFRSTSSSSRRTPTPTTPTPSYF